MMTFARPFATSRQGQATTSIKTRHDFKGNIYRELLARAIEHNGGYSRSFEGSYALEWNVALNFGMPDARQLAPYAEGGPAYEQLAENWGVSREDFVREVPTPRFDAWVEEWDDDDNRQNVWDWVRESMCEDVTGTDCYRSLGPEIAARYGLPGSHAKLHSGRKYHHEHKYRDGAWDHSQYFDVEWEFHGRQGKHLVLTEFEGHKLNVNGEFLADWLRNDKERNYPNVWCQKLLAFIHECDTMFDHKAVKQEFEYHVAFRAANELHYLYNGCVKEAEAEAQRAEADAKEAKEAQYWAERDSVTK